MRRTDDFIADLDAQLAAAAAGTLRRRRRSPRALLMPIVAAAAAAAAVSAFVLAAGSGTDPERAAQPPQPPAGGAPFELAPAAGGACAAEPVSQTRPPAEVLEELSVLRRAAAPRGRGPASDSPLAREARADAPVTVVPMTRVGSCVGNATADDPPGVCAIVELSEVRSACFTMDEVERLQAAAALQDGFLVAVLPDGVQEATFVIGTERDTYRVTDNVVVANLDAATPGARLQIVSGGGTPAAGGCGDGQVLDTPLPGELKVALPVLAGGDARVAPDEVMDLLAKGGASRIWASEARRLLAGEDAGAWLVPVADSRFADCGEPLITAPRAFEGPGACLVGTFRGEPKAAVCADLDDLLTMVMVEVPGRRLAFGFLPHWASAGADIGGKRLANLGGAFAGFVPADAAPKAAYVGEGEGRHPVAVIGPEAELARERIAAGDTAADVRSSETDGGRSAVWYAPGMVSSARRIAELLRVARVLPMDPKVRALAGEDTDVLVIAGEDLRP